MLTKIKNKYKLNWALKKTMSAKLFYNYFKTCTITSVNKIFKLISYNFNKEHLDLY